MALPKPSPKVPVSLILAALLLLAFAGSFAQAMTAPDPRPKTGLLTCNPCNVKFSKTDVGSTKTLPVVLTNNSSSNITISQLNDNAPAFSVTGLTLPLTLGAGKTVTFNVTFAPTDNGRMAQNIELISNASDASLTIYLYGVGVMDGSLVATPWGMDFGNLQTGDSSTKSLVLTNSGTSTVTVSKATTTGTGFKSFGLNPPLTLTAGQSLTFSMTFTPKAVGYVTGTLSVVSDAPNPTLTIPLSGTGTSAGELAVTPSSLNFGSVAVGTSKGLAGTLSATAASVTVSSVSSSSSEFVLSGLTFPVTIAAGTSASFTVTFTPGASGAATGTISFVSDADNSPAVESLQGIGVQQQQHRVDLSWDSSGDSEIVGYNVYRSSKAEGPYSMLNSDLDPVTNYSDSTVSGGLTYFYQATAVDSSGTESKPSNRVKAIIPSP